MAKGAILGQETNTDELENKFNSYLPLSGGTMSGQLNMNGNKLTNIPNPVNDGDAVNFGFISNVKKSDTGIYSLKFFNRYVIQLQTNREQQIEVPDSNKIMITIFPYAGIDREVGGNSGAGFIPISFVMQKQSSNRGISTYYTVGDAGIVTPASFLIKLGNIKRNGRKVIFSKQEVNLMVEVYEFIEV